MTELIELVGQWAKEKELDKADVEISRGSERSGGGFSEKRSRCIT